MRVLKSPISVLLMVLVLAATAGCSGKRARGPARHQESTTVRVDNRKFLDVNVYVIAGGQRRRLGTVPGISSRVFTIPPTMIFGMATLRFQADPIGSDETPVSHEITIREGDRVTLTIPS